MKNASLVDTLRHLQKRNNLEVKRISGKEKVGFVYSTKERVDFSLRTLPGIDQEGGFDLIWLDGSDSKAGRELPYKYQFKNAKLREIHLDVKGGPDAAIRFGLGRLLALDYDYCGLLENDIMFQPGWFKKLLKLLDYAAADGLEVGAATVRNFESRVLECRQNYTINWNIGAGMVLFSKPAAQIILDAYRKFGLGSWTTARKVLRFYAELLGVDLRRIGELWFGRKDRRLSPDWAFDMLLYKQGMVTVGSIPSLAEDLEFDVIKDRRTTYVSPQSQSQGVITPLLGKEKLLWIKLFDPLYSLGWKVLRPYL